MDDQWDSPPFYTHPQGYKFSLVVQANGYGASEGTGVTVGVIMMRGEYDESLAFPFCGKFTIQILNWTYEAIVFTYPNLLLLYQ